MKSAFSRLEKVVILLSILCFLSLFIIQSLNYNKNHIFNSYNINDKTNVSSFSRMEDDKRGVVVLKNMDPRYGEIKIILNDKPIVNFLENDEIELKVCDGDILEVDGTRYNHNLNIKVVGISSNVKFPELGLVLTTSQSIEIIGKVELK